MKKYLSLILISALALGIGASLTQASTLPITPALFETSLSAPIGSSDTSMTIVANKLLDGTAISGYSCFTVDSNQPNVEYICGTVASTSVTGLTRGISPLNGTTTVTSLKFSHRRGADVKITDFPTVSILQRILGNLDTIPQAIRYDSSIATSTLSSNRDNLVNWGVVQDTAFTGSGAIAATTAAKGYVQIATGAQASASTGIGSTGATLVIPSSVATSTWSSGNTNLIPTTGSTGKIDPNFIATSTLNAYGQPVVNIYSTTTASSTWTKNTGLKYVVVQVQGGGGSVGSAVYSNGGAMSASTASAAGGYASLFVPASSLTSTVSIGVGAGASTGGTTGQSSNFGAFVSATGGQGVSGGTDTVSTATTTGGIGVGGDVNIQGQGGGAPLKTDSASNIGFSAPGGNSRLGFGGLGNTSSGSIKNAQSGVGYGSGASGAITTINNTTALGAPGNNGVVIVTEYYI